MSYAAAIFLALVVPLCLSWVSRDAYACFPLFQKFVLRLAAKMLPTKMSATAVEQWAADIADLPPSELYRTWFALDMLRGAFRIRQQHYHSKNAALKLRAENLRDLEMRGEELQRRGKAILEMVNGVTLEGATKEKYDRVNSEVKELDVRMVRLRAARIELAKQLSPIGRLSRLIGKGL
jgi:hypothetical protein